LGDSDAVSLGDYHLPHQVAWALAGEPRGTEARMLELLAPYRGHRARVIRLLTLGGIQAPRFGPRMRLRRIAAITARTLFWPAEDTGLSRRRGRSCRSPAYP